MSVWAERYEILDELGRGGNGVVYRVRDLKLGRELALKLLSDGEEILAVREAHALTGLESPHVLRVFNAGVYRDVPFIATDVAALGSADDHIQVGVGVAPALAVRWVRQALVGLDYCHRRNVLHRDLTPGNIFLNSTDHALLGDFGIAANLEADDTAAAAGNQRCRAPEGFGGRLSRQSDLYSAGATLWRLLVGEWPYDAATEAELAGKMRGQDRPRLRDIAPHIHRSIAAVVERALDPDPKSRPVSASDMARDLAQTRLHNRNWVRVKPDAGVEAAFQSTGGASSLVVEMRGDGSRASIVTRHASSGRRVLAGCVETTASRVRIELRKLFDSV